MIAVVAAAGALSWLAVESSAGGDGAAAQAMQPVADEGPGFAIEDFGYPNADKILAEKKIVLKRGDGHIVLAECGAPGLFEIWSRDVERVCFKVSGSKGYLALEIPSVYSVKSSGYSARIDMTTGAEERSFDIPKDIWTPVGESADPQTRNFALMEIRTNK
ncbi:hypothetical protein [Streptomyces sp. NPDC051546]|uniref:hypothetical protein n=1 Tax=Streptomyces sp. NPDC051546 TaxID=3365655 RepID=UPI003799B3B8